MRKKTVQKNSKTKARAEEAAELTLEMSSAESVDEIQEELQEEIHNETLEKTEEEIKAETQIEQARLDETKLQALLEAIILAATHPLSEEDILKLFTEDERPSKSALRAALKALQEPSPSRGVALTEVASGYQFQVKLEWAPMVSRLWEEKAPRYSRALFETLALIAYRQPITRGEIEEIRGVSLSPSIFKTLVDEREWVRIVGHREVPGRPALYATTKNFLDYFGLKSLEELPSLPEIMNLDTVQLPDISEFPAHERSVNLPASETPSEEISAAEEISESTAEETSEIIPQEISESKESLDDAEESLGPEEPEALEEMYEFEELDEQEQDEIENANENENETEHENEPETTEEMMSH